MKSELVFEYFLNIYNHHEAIESVSNIENIVARFPVTSPNDKKRQIEDVCALLDDISLYDPFVTDNIELSDRVIFRYLGPNLSKKIRSNIMDFGYESEIAQSALDKQLDHHKNSLRKIRDIVNGFVLIGVKNSPELTRMRNLHMFFQKIRTILRFKN